MLCNKVSDLYKGDFTWHSGVFALWLIFTCIMSFLRPSLLVLKLSIFEISALLIDPTFLFYPASHLDVIRTFLNLLEKPRTAQSGSALSTFYQALLLSFYKIFLKLALPDNCLRGVRVLKREAYGCGLFLCSEIFGFLRA